MLQEIKDKVALSADMKSVLHLVLKADTPLCILKLAATADSKGGEIWLKDGNHIVAAATTDGKNGHDALLELLSLEEAKYELVDAEQALDDQCINIKVKDILDDRRLVIEALRSVLDAGVNNGEDVVITDEHNALTESVEGFAGSDSESQSAQAKAFNERSVELATEDKDDLAALRKQQIERSKTSNGTDDESFLVSGLLPPETSEEDEARMEQLHALKEISIEGKDEFYQTPVPIEEGPDGGLNEQQQKVLKIMQEQYSDTASFLHQDELLSEQASLKPQWSEELPALEPRSAVDADQQLPLVLAGATTNVAGDEASSVPNADPATITSAGLTAVDSGAAEKTQSALDSKKEPDWRRDSVRLRSLELNLEEIKGTVEPQTTDADGKVVKVVKGRQVNVRAPISVPKPVLVGLGVAIVVLPLLFMNMSQHHEEEAEIELDEKETTTAHVNNYVDKESRAAKASQEPSRMPAGSPSGGGSGHPYLASGETGRAGDGFSGEDDFHWQQPKQAAPSMSQEQVTEAERELQTSERLMSTGQTEQAVMQLDADVNRFPRFIRLRVAAIEANRKLGRHERVRQLCIEGMHNAAVEADFYLMLNMMKDLPRTR